MPAHKVYKMDPDDYEKKLARVMERFGIPESDYDWNWDRHGAFVWFRYKGEVYRFDYTVAQAKAKGEKLQYGSDAFSRVVLTLEDLARMIERGIYDLQTWVAGMKFLPPPRTVPWWMVALGLDGLQNEPGPIDEARIRKVYREKAKSAHPDAPGGSDEAFKTLNRAQEEGLAWLKEQQT